MTDPLEDLPRLDDVEVTTPKAIEVDVAPDATVDDVADAMADAAKDAGDDDEGGES